MLVYAYLGPETFLPMTSIVAAAAGVLLVSGRHLLRFVLGVFQLARRR